jgi:hypothetical protein
MGDVTDQPYKEMVDAGRETHKRILDIHLGKIPPPTDRQKHNKKWGGLPTTPLFFIKNHIDMRNILVISFTCTTVVFMHSKR